MYRIRERKEPTTNIHPEVLSHEEARYILSTIEDPIARDIYEAFYENNPEGTFLQYPHVHPEEEKVFVETYEKLFLQIITLLEEDWNVLVLKGPMYSDKSGTAQRALEYLEKEKGKNILRLIAGELGESSTTARGCLNQETGEIEAVTHKVNTICEDNYMEIIKQIEDEDIDVIHIDEAFFIKEEIIIEVIEMAKRTNKKLILTGLEKSMLGTTFPVAADTNEYFQDPKVKIINTRSHRPVYKKDYEQEEIAMYPTCDETARYFYKPYTYEGVNKHTHLRDIGIMYPVVISKEITDFLYVPTIEADSVKDVFEKAEMKELLKLITEPTEELEHKKKINMLSYLTNRYYELCNLRNKTHEEIAYAERINEAILSFAVKS